MSSAQQALEYLVSTARGNDYADEAKIAEAEQAIEDALDDEPVRVVARFEGFLIDITDKAWADGYNRAKVDMLSASIGERAECAACSGRGVWMDEPCNDCEGEAND